MKLVKSKILLLCVAGIMLLFFSNDFGLIDIEKTAIITAIAIDLKDNEYEVTTQIAVPEATDVNSEDKKAVISSTGSTIGGALKNISNLSGWFPKLSFCNLIILGNSIAQTNTIKVVDYFAKTLRVQDSATIIVAEKTAKELLEKSSPLDNISSFALQKILLKNPGFDKNVAAVDIKTFCSDYYSDASSSKMPLVKIIEIQNSESGTSNNSSQSPTNQSAQNGEQSSGNQCIFDATTTALFKNGVMVGEIDKMQTLTYNLLFDQTTETTLSVNDVSINNSKPADYLLTILRNSAKIDVCADKNAVNLNINLDIYCKISDINSDSQHEDYAYNKVVPEEVLRSAEELIIKNLNDLILTQQQTQCDIFGVKKLLYRKNYKYYHSFKDNYLSVLNPSISVTFSG